MGGLKVCISKKLLLLYPRIGLGGIKNSMLRYIMGVIITIIDIITIYTIITVNVINCHIILTVNAQVV